MKPRIKKDAYTGRWQCATYLGFREGWRVGYGFTPAQAYAQWFWQLQRVPGTSVWMAAA